MVVGALSNDAASNRTPEPVDADACRPIHTVFSVDGSPYQQWQAELLAYSHHKAGQSGSLTRLWSARGRPTDFPGRTVWTKPYSPHPVTGDHYPAYNKPAAILQWLSDVSPPEEVVLVIDPDCIFVEPVTTRVERGRPAAQPYSYLDPNAHPGKELVSRHCRRPSLVQGVGVPYVIHRDDLGVLAPLWLAKTEAIRGDRKSRELAGWTAEMWGYALAAAELCLVHELRELQVVPKDQRSDEPIIHYCEESVDASGGWRWGKWTYRAWEPVPPPPRETATAVHSLVELLNECAGTRQYCLEP